jgi:hypothetical protein
MMASTLRFHGTYALSPVVTVARHVYVLMSSDVTEELSGHDYSQSRQLYRLYNTRLSPQYPPNPQRMDVVLPTNLISYARLTHAGKRH